ncbi:hypothetical protein SCHPADRAFT_942802 [Schizopora paradoxa]|uniref:NACHT domain-containing protein n=1 Tax=Schizopora paradoxa TaxID=27342 RepID=A0A0H2RF45_9AGAM|nr:hypothetical protein SCHPADRAFT_942802 [Schizopora paradoxa]
MSNLQNLRKVYSSKRYVTIHSVEFPSNGGAKKPKSVFVLIGDKEVKTKSDKKDKSTWILPERTIAFDDEKLRIQLRSNSSSRSQRESLIWEPEQTGELAVSELVSFLGSRDPTESHKYPKRSNQRSVSFQVSLQSLFEDIGDCADATLKLIADDDKAKDELSRLDVKTMKSVLSSLSDNVDAINIVTNSLKGVSKIHPIAQAVTSVVLLPLQLMKNEHIFTGRVKSLVENMKETLERLNMVQNIEDFQYSRDILRSMMKDYLRFQIYVCKLKKMNGAVRMLKAHSDTKELGDFEHKFKENGEKLRDMIMMESAADTKQVLSTQEKDELRRLLDPVVTSRPRECHDGTREGVLQMIEDWIDNSNYKNILWISGAPGVGKSALSSSTVKLLETRWRNKHTNPFAVFFINRQASRDPRPIWRTVAHRLALSFPDYRMQLLNILREDMRSDGVKKQFEDLINAPFGKIYQSRHVPEVVPVIVIDALDECLSETEYESMELLDTIMDWKFLPSSCKLIVFSRRESVIVRRLEPDGGCEKIILPSGQGVTGDSEASRDVRRFLEASFNKISHDHGIEREAWPEAEELDQLVGYASGLFIVPTTVVKYVGGWKGDPVSRLRNVLGHMRRWENSSRAFDPIKALYAQILVDTFSSLENDDERESMLLVLAFLVFQRGRLPRDELVHLLAHTTSKSLITSAINNLMSVVKERSILHHHDEIQCNHRTFVDIFDSENPELLPISSQNNNSEAWIGEKAYQKRFDASRDKLSPQLKRSTQCLRLANACLLALNAELSFEFPSPHKEVETDIRGVDNIPPSLLHASQYWRKYCEFAGEASNDLPLHPYKLALGWMESLNLIAKENNSESGQQKDFETRFAMYQKALRKDFTRSNRNVGHSRPSHHIAETEHHRILVDPSMQPESDTHSPDSPEIQEAERIELEQLLRLLAPKFQSLPRGCQPGTRVSILDRIKKWVKDSVPANSDIGYVSESANSPFAGAGAGPSSSPTSNSNVLWISGLRFSGKTAIASSVVTLLNSTEFGDVIHAHYFISFRVGYDPRSVWRTIAYQLAISSPAYRRLLLEQGILTMETEDLDIKDLFNAFIKAPLLRLNISTVVVIDALCEFDYRMREDFSKTLADWKSLPSSCRLIVTSYKLNDIARELDRIYNIDLESSDELKETMDDIRFLFADAFEKVQREGWPEDGEIDELVKHAKGSLLWATTVIRFVVNGRGGDLRSRLDDILRVFRGIRHFNGNPLDLLCALILTHTHSHLETDDERESMFLFLAFLTFQEAPLSHTELGELLRHDIFIILDNLSSILIFGASDEGVGFTHSNIKSAIHNFRQYGLPDYVKSFVQNLSESKQNLRLTHACLRFMKKSLAAQVHEHPKLTAPHRSVNTSRAEDKDTAKVSNALKYACSYWVGYMDTIGNPPPGLFM